MEKTVLSLNGLPRSGKDVNADYLVKKHGYQKMAFADELKNIICRTFEITREQLDEYKNNPYQYKIMVENIDTGNVVVITNFRKLLQLFGTEGMKPAFGESVWADIVYKKIEESEHDKFVISDFRFLCEYKQPEGINNLPVLITDDRELPTEGHASDVELYQNDFEFKYIINNPKTKEYFKNIDNTIKDIEQ